MWLFPWRGRRVLQGSRSCAFPCRLGEMGCRVPRGAEWRGGGYYREQIARISQAKRRPRGLSCSEIKPLISIQRKAEEGASRGRGSSSSAPVCFAFHFPALPPPTPTPQVQVDLIKWTGTVHCRRRFPALIKWDLTHQWAHIQSSAVFFLKYHFSQFFYTNAALSSDCSANGAFLWAHWLDAFV